MFRDLVRRQLAGFGSELRYARPQSNPAHGLGFTRKIADCDCHPALDDGASLDEFFTASCRDHDRSQEILEASGLSAVKLDGRFRRAASPDHSASAGRPA